MSGRECGQEKAVSEGSPATLYCPSSKAGASRGSGLEVMGRGRPAIVSGPLVDSGLKYNIWDVQHGQLQMRLKLRTLKQLATRLVR